VTSLLTDEHLDVSKQLSVLRLTSSGTDLDPDTDDLVNGLKIRKYTSFYSKINRPINPFMGTLIPYSNGPL